MFIEGLVGKNTTAFQLLIFILQSQNYTGEVRKNGDNSELRITLETDNWAKLNISHLMFQTEWGAREELLLSPQNWNQPTPMINLFYIKRPSLLCALIALNTNNLRDP